MNRADKPEPSSCSAFVAVQPYKWFFNYFYTSLGRAISLKASQKMRSQVETRRSALKAFRRWKNTCYPAPYYRESCAEPGQVVEATAHALHELSNVLSQENGEKLLLYLPFELLPCRYEDLESDKLLREAKEFAALYRQNWKRLAMLSSTRADFIDGDIPEVEDRPEELRRVVKAAHIAPFALCKNLITDDEIKLESSSSTEFAQSFREVKDLPLLLSYNAVVERAPQKWVGGDAGKLLERKISNARRWRQTRREGQSIKRSDWLLERDIMYLIDDFARSFARFERFNGEAKIAASTCEARAAILLGKYYFIRECENICSRETALDVLNDAINGSCSANPFLNKVSRTVVSRLASMRFMREQTLRDLDIQAPSAEYDPAKNKMLVKFGLCIAHEIQITEALREMILPLVILYGSRVKGYFLDQKSADVDIAVMVRPDFPFARRAELQEKLRELFKRHAINESPFEFWLEKRDDGLAIRDCDPLDKKLADSTVADVLFHGLWCADETTMQEEGSQILERYMHSGKRKLVGIDERKLWLREMERGALQYRLLHRYHDFFPERGYVKTLPLDMAGRSAFFDTGYRMLATELFLTNVFLPNLD